MARKHQLTAKQKLFVDHYLRSFNGTQAAEDAGYKGSRATLAAVGYENLRKPHIRAQIEDRLEEVAMGANEVLARLASMARGFDPADYISIEKTYVQDKQGEVHLSGTVVTLDLAALQNDGHSHLIKSLRNTGAGPIFEFYDQQAALVHIGKGHKLFAERFEHTGPAGGPIEHIDIEAIRQKRWDAIKDMLPAVLSPQEPSDPQHSNGENE
ncbi:MAG: terminase small subunit [Chloroflexi bacterium]|nr:MAG: terminase small subunit [Chloroflexota bacterium]